MCKARSKACTFVQVTRLRPRKKAGETENESHSRKKNLVWTVALDHHGRPPWSPKGSSLWVPTTPYLSSPDIRRHRRVQRNFIHPGVQCFRADRFIFYPICKVGTKYLFYSLSLDKVPFKSYSPLSCLLAHSIKIKWDWEWSMLLLLMMNATKLCVIWRVFHIRFLCLAFYGFTESCNYLFLNNTNEDLQQDLHSKLVKTMLEKSGFCMWLLSNVSHIKINGVFNA